MFASFVWISFVTVARADGSSVENRLKTYASTQIEEATLFEGERRRDAGDVDDALRDGVRSMAVQAGFRFKDCVADAPMGGMMQRFIVMFAPTILGGLMNFEVENERRRWGFNRNNFIANVAEPLQLQAVGCDDLYSQCIDKAMEVFESGLQKNQADVATRYPFAVGNMDALVSCAVEEIPDICADYKYLVCSESEGN